MSSAPQDAMLAPGFYPHGPAQVERVESHISWVFLAGERAYKLRKPVVFPFLDYGTAERRRAMSEEEVRLGRRLAPDIYLGVRPLVRRGDGWVLGDPGREGAEHVVEMRRFDPDRTLSALMGRNAAGAATVREVARRIAAFHAEAEPAPPGRFDPSAVAATVGENFSTLLPYAPLLGEADLAGAHRFAVAFLHAHRPLLEERVARGFVRDCHGDLRAEHVILERGQVEVFDPLEFDPALREIDVSADLAFLVMDLMDAGAEDLAQALVDEYEACGGDHGGTGLLFFYAAYRAWVRAKVACLRAGELRTGAERAGPVAEARRLAALARRLAWRAREPLVLVVCGGSATGKTVLAQAIRGVSGWAHLSSDVVRKELAGLEPRQRAPAEQYSDEISLRTYRELGARAAGLAGRGAVVDATFRSRAHRAAFAETFRAEASFVECVVPASVVAERAARREADPERVSDATPTIAAEQVSHFDPLDEVPAARHLLLRTDLQVHRLVETLEAALDAKWATRSVAST
jgi:aminoglycoside phosphotransferase family enzyme/predicted kinase